MKKILGIFLIFLPALAYANDVVPGQDSLYSEKQDTLEAAAVATGQGNYISRLQDVKTEVISSAGLCKMACCTLAESFENSASVTVGYSDAVTGARQIRLLGLSGIYSQMLDESRPIMRGLSSPFGLSYVPGQWLNSIQIAKGASSVLTGIEGITGQINMEYRKPTDEIPLFVNASMMSDTKMDLNIASSLQFGKDGRWSTAILGHLCGNFCGMDMNADGIIDDPRQLHINLSNRWLYMAPNGTQIRFGLHFLRDKRGGGEYNPSGDWSKKPAYDYLAYVQGESPYWGSSIVNQSVGAYVKVGVPLNEDNTQNIAFIGDFSDYMTDSGFGLNKYDASQISTNATLLYQNQMFVNHHITCGVQLIYDHFNEMINGPIAPYGCSNAKTDLLDFGFFFEYTYKLNEKLSLIAGARGEAYKDDGMRFIPRFTAKYSPWKSLAIRFNLGRGLRYATPLADNIGTLSTSKDFYCFHSTTPSGVLPLYASHPLEDAWTLGANIIWYMPFGVGENSTYLSFDYFRTNFTRQLVVDYDSMKNGIDFYLLGKPDESFTNNYQVDFACEPFRRFTISATFRYTDARVTLTKGLQERPMTSRYKGVLNLQYATNLNKWIFDFTASVNGPCKVYDFMVEQRPDLYKNGLSPVYPLLYFQVTHRMKGWDIYLGGENLTNFRQKDVLFGTALSEEQKQTRAITMDPSRNDFDASCVWGPLSGIKVYAGVRITLWKKN